jgi:hypothetical protein
MNRFPRLLLWLFLALGSALGGAAAQEPQRPILHTNEAYLEEAMRASVLDVKDPKAVFAYVFATLPERVKVYPTENYYYFTFIYDGVPYDGNIRLDASNRDEGKVIFAYSEDLEEWRGETEVLHVILDASMGVMLEKLEPLVYRMTFQQKSVVFALNDLSQVRPPANALAPNEKFIGPIFDESGVRFFLVYDSKLKLFHYIVDETVKLPDQLERSRRSDRILIGKRTGFAFYKDHLRDRKIMIGAFASNMRVNNYFDGPFDQLPDNFIEGETLRKAILEVAPYLKGQIDRFGGSPDGSQRFAIDAYVPYQSEGDLYPVHRCATSTRGNAAAYYACFAVDNDMKHRPQLRSAGSTKHSVRRRRPGAAQ